jgi:hypothetical protein
MSEARGDTSRPEGPESAARPWRGIAQWSSHQEFIDRSHECLRLIREQALESEAEADLRALLDPDARWDLFGGQPGDEIRRRAMMVLWALIGGQAGRDPDAETWLTGCVTRGFGEVGQAWFELGFFLFVIGEGVVAEVPLRRAIEAGHPDYVDQGLHYLALVLDDEDGREEEVRELRDQLGQWGPPFGTGI